MKKIVAFFVVFLAWALGVQAAIRTGENFEVAVDTSKKIILRGWLPTEGRPDLASLRVWSPTGDLLFRGLYPLRISFSPDRTLEVRLGTPDFIARYSSAFTLPTDRCQATGTLRSNFGVSYPGVLSYCGGRFAYSYVSDTSAADGISTAEVGMITNDPDFAQKGEYIDSLPTGRWYAVGIDMGARWVPVRGVIEANLQGAAGMVIRTDTGGFDPLTLQRETLQGATMWLHERGDVIIMWRHMDDGTSDGFFFILTRILD